MALEVAQRGWDKVKSDPPTEGLAGIPAPTTPTCLTNETIAKVSRYCWAAWNNARLPRDSWEDCTQEVLTRLLITLESADWTAIFRKDSAENKELRRAIDAAKKRTQREKSHAELTDDFALKRKDPRRNDNTWNDVSELAELVSPRQWRILSLFREGRKIPEIACALQTTVDRVSDEKYKAVRRLSDKLLGLSSRRSVTPSKRRVTQMPAEQGAPVVDTLSGS